MIWIRIIFAVRLHCSQVVCSLVEELLRRVLKTYTTGHPWKYPKVSQRNQLHLKPETPCHSEDTLHEGTADTLLDLCVLAEPDA